MSIQSKRSKGDCVYYSHLKPNRKTPIAYSTRATMDWLVCIHQDYPQSTIRELYYMLINTTQFIYNPDAIDVLKKYINFGEGDVVPMWN